MCSHCHADCPGETQDQACGVVASVGCPGSSVA